MNDEISSRIKSSYFRREDNNFNMVTSCKIRKFEELISPCFSLNKQLSPEKRIQKDEMIKNVENYSRMIDRLVAVNFSNNRDNSIFSGSKC
jgi:hypothetical protein